MMFCFILKRSGCKKYTSHMMLILPPQAMSPFGHFSTFSTCYSVKETMLQKEEV